MKILTSMYLLICTVKFWWSFSGWLLEKLKYRKLEVKLEWSTCRIVQYLCAGACVCLNSEACSKHRAWRVCGVCVCHGSHTECQRTRRTILKFKLAKLLISKFRRGHHRDTRPSTPPSPPTPPPLPTARPQPFSAEFKIRPRRNLCPYSAAI